jgi:RNA polymerase sigma factor (sigma-70 family)
MTTGALPPFQHLLDEHGPAVWRFVRASVGSVDGADCYQEAILAALRAYPTLRHGDNLKGWLFTVAHRKVLDHHRRMTRRREAPRQPPEQPVLDGEPPDTALWAAVGRLPTKQRLAVLHRFVADLAYVDIAGLLGCSEAAARQNVRAGLARLRKEPVLATGATTEDRP